MERITLLKNDGATVIGNAMLLVAGPALPSAIIWRNRVFTAGFRFGSAPLDQGTPYNEKSILVIADDDVTPLPVLSA